MSSSRGGKATTQGAVVETGSILCCRRKEYRQGRRDTGKMAGLEPIFDGAAGFYSISQEASELTSTHFLWRMRDEVRVAAESQIHTEIRGYIQDYIEKARG